MPFEEAVQRFEELHRLDPRFVEVAGEAMPWSVFYHRRLAEWVERLDADASVPLRLAARCQHVLRWTIPRSSYPQGRAGYRRWRDELARMHSEQAAIVLKDTGYDEATIRRVGDLLLKRGLGRDLEVQLFEDAICLVFLENELAEFAGRHPREKIARILKKTLRKMSPRGRSLAEDVVRGLPAPLVEVFRESTAVEAR
jgi:hypothetical protein